MRGPKDVNEEYARAKHIYRPSVDLTALPVPLAARCMSDRILGLAAVAMLRRHPTAIRPLPAHHVDHAPPDPNGPLRTLAVHHP